jgi:segregation and condensation protein A
MEKEEDFERKNIEKVGQEQIHGLLFVEKIGWKEIINELISTEQLDPWDIDLCVLTNKFLDKVHELEEANFFISSQVLLAASLLLRFKSDILLNHYIPELDAVLFGRKKEDKKYIQERIELDEDVPGLILRTPLPRFRKVTLDELMKALGHAINTENRRIRKVVIARQMEIETALALPRRRINIKDRIREVHSDLRKIFARQQEKIAFSEFAGKTMEDRIATFIPLLHLDTQHKIWLEQEAHLGEIWILLKHLYEKQNADVLEAMKKEAETAIETLVKEEQVARDTEDNEETTEDDVKDTLGSLTGFSNKRVDEMKELNETEEPE